MIFIFRFQKEIYLNLFEELMKLDNPEDRVKELMKEIFFILEKHLVKKKKLQ